MPEFDTILNLSVFHHWVRVYGQDQAQKMLYTLSQKCKTLIFETGQADEINAQWSAELKFMGDNPKDWIEAFLKNAGFKKIQIIGSFPTGLTEVNRYLFCASR